MVTVLLEYLNLMICSCLALLCHSIAVNVISFKSQRFELRMMVNLYAYQMVSNIVQYNVNTVPLYCMINDCYKLSSYLASVYTSRSLL